MSFSNVYEDRQRASAYATLEFPGTYHLAYRDLPAIIATHVTGRAALDFGCGAGRSTRFLQRRGFDADDLRAVLDRRFDLVLAAFPFDPARALPAARPPRRALRVALGDVGRAVGDLRRRPARVIAGPERAHHRSASRWPSIATDVPSSRPDRASVSASQQASLAPAWVMRNRCIRVGIISSPCSAPAGSSFTR